MIPLLTLFYFEVVFPSSYLYWAWLQLLIPPIPLRYLSELSTQGRFEVTCWACMA